MAGTKILIDFTAFRSSKGDHDVVIKELSIVDIESKCAQHWIFSPPTHSQPWTSKPQDLWLSRHHHGIEFYTGFANYDSLIPALNFHSSKAQLLFAQTREKAKILEKIFNARRLVFDLESLGCPPLPRDGLFPESLDCDNVEDHGLDTVDCVKSTPSNKPCLYHHFFATNFSCTLANVLNSADWCRANMELLDMNNPDVRVKTFDNWKISTPSAKELADCGFVRVATTPDSTQCVYCGLVLYKWEEGDDAIEDHDWNSSSCRLRRYQLQLKRQAEQEENRQALLANLEDYSPKTAATKEYQRRYHNYQDISEEDVFKLCKA